MKKYLSFFLVLIVALLSFVGCSKEKDNNSGVKKDESNEITFMIPDWGAPTQEMLDEFKKESGITVKVQPTSWDDIRDKVSIAAAGKKVAADIFEVDWSWVGEFKSAGWLMPIEMDKKDIEDMPTIKSFTVDDKIYALPYANDFRIAYYNKDQFAKAGIQGEPQTWDDVENGCKALKDNNIVKYPFSIPLGADENATTSFIWLAYTRNEVIFNNDNTLNKESALDALTLIDKLNKAGYINPANRTSNGMTAYKQLTNGEASFMVGPSSFVSRVNNPKESKVVDQVEPIMIPGKTGKAKVTVPYAEGIGISSFTKNPKACEKFVKWYTSPETQIKLNEELNTMPTRTDVLKKLIDEGKIKNAGALLEEAKIVKSPFPNGVPKYYTKMSTEIFNTINQMVNGKLTPEQAVDQMANKVDALAKENAE